MDRGLAEAFSMNAVHKITGLIREQSRETLEMIGDAEIMLRFVKVDVYVNTLSQV